MNKCVINRSTLLTGAAQRALNDAAVLYDSETGLSCVVGQYLLHLGISKRSITDYCRVPPSIHGMLPEWLADERVVDAINQTNDGKLHQIRREAKLIRQFAAQGVVIEFTGRYADATAVAKRYARS